MDIFQKMQTALEKKRALDLFYLDKQERKILMDLATWKVKYPKAFALLLEGPLTMVHPTCNITAWKEGWWIQVPVNAVLLRWLEEHLNKPEELPLLLAAKDADGIIAPPKYASYAQQLRDLLAITLQQ